MSEHEMREKFFLTLDSNSGYTMENFLKEFENKNIDVNYNKITLDFKNESTNDDPAYASEEAAGFDLRANIETQYFNGGAYNWLTIKPRQFIVIPTGLYFDIPKGFEMQIRPRSGLAAKHGITVLNSPGTIDSDYIGEIKVILINHGESAFTINHGDRIAQAVISSVTAKSVINLNKVDDITKETERGEGGLGSTGVN